ncbi:RNA-guided endonuclease InsQ/TnpB family protein [Halorutilales archaeon Cl-col2-1]
METNLTITAEILNHSQVESDLDRHGWSASKLWNIARYYTREVWEKTGEIPEEDTLKTELKEHERYEDLHSQSSQKVLEELSEAYQSWYGSDDDRDNPPGYRKRWYYDGSGNLVHEEHPRSTVTWKNRGIRHDSDNNRVRLSKGKNHKQVEERSDFILIEYDLHRPYNEIDGSIQQVRAVYDEKEEKWELHLVVQKEIEVEDSGEETVGIDLGISNFAALSFENGDTVLYPGNELSQNNYYFEKEKAKLDKSDGRERTRLDHLQSERRRHFLHSLSKHIVEECKKRDVGKIAVGDLEDIRQDDDGEARNWRDSGNLNLHKWAFDRFTGMLEYKARLSGIELERIDEENTSKTCCVCGKLDGDQRVERGLYVCDDCDTVANSDVNGAENIRQKSEGNSESSCFDQEDRSIGCLAQPGVYLYDRSCGFEPQEAVG